MMAYILVIPDQASQLTNTYAIMCAYMCVEPACVLHVFVMQPLRAVHADDVRGVLCCDEMCMNEGPLDPSWPVQPGR